MYAHTGTQSLTPAPSSPRVVAVQLLVPLLPGKHYFLRVEHDHVVARVHCAREGELTVRPRRLSSGRKCTVQWWLTGGVVDRLGLALQQTHQLHGQTPHDLAPRVYLVPQLRVRRYALQIGGWRTG